MQLPLVRITGERGREYARRVGTNLFPVLAAEPITGTLPGLGKQRVYLHDVDRLAPAHRDALVALMAERFALPAEEVLADLVAGRGPIRDGDDVELVWDDPTAWG